MVFEAIGGGRGLSLVSAGGVRSCDLLVLLDPPIATEPLGALLSCLGVSPSRRATEEAPGVFEGCYWGWPGVVNVREPFATVYPVRHFPVSVAFAAIVYPLQPLPVRHLPVAFTAVYPLPPSTHYHHLPFAIA